MKVHNKAAEDEDFTVIELKESKGGDNEDQFVNYQNKTTNEIFNISFANNYLVLITSSKDVDITHINKSDYKNGFAIVGYLSTQEKTNANETPKSLTVLDSSRLKRYLKKEWTSCYVRPIEKITTFIRYFYFRRLFFLIGQGNIQV